MFSPWRRRAAVATILDQAERFAKWRRQALSSPQRRSRKFMPYESEKLSEHLTKFMALPLAERHS
jgi:hypothetical protein